MGQGSEDRFEAFLHLDKADSHELEHMGCPHRFAKGERVWDEGDASSSVWLVKEGRVNMEIVSPEGNASLVHFCTQAQVFCPAAAVIGGAYPCAAIAAEAVTAVAVPRTAFMAFFDRLPSLAKGFLRQMAPLMCESHCRQARAMDPVQARLAGVLGDLNRRYHGEKLHFTRRELAGMSGTTVETAIRTLSRWEKEGVIHSDRGFIEIRRPQELEAVA